MELDKIEKLLEKYFEATTTVAEEETLKAYFAKETIASHLEQYAPMFQYFSEAKDEQYTKQLPFTATNTIHRRTIYKWVSAAAVGLLLFGIYFGSDYMKQRQLEKEQAEFAYQETKRALNLLAENFNRGTEKVYYLNEFETTKQKIYNSK